MGAANRKGHRWINWPNNSHKKCTKCGCLYDQTYDSETKGTVIRYSMNGVTSMECPDCKTVSYE